MRNWFKKESTDCQSRAVPETPYQRAQQEWDDRIGTTRIQASNWRFIAFLSMMVALLSLIMLAISFYLNQDRVYVAEVTKAGRIVNVMPMQVAYNPSVAQKEYFLSNFIKLFRTIPLDPVVAKKNWMNAYHFLTQRSSEELNQHMKSDNPLALLGKKTVTVEITDVNPVSDTTFQVDWTENTVGVGGQIEAKKNYSGVFTVMVQQPKTESQIIINPLGIYITDFHISLREK